MDITRPIIFVCLICYFAITRLNAKNDVPTTYWKHNTVKLNYYPYKKKNI